MARRYVLGPNAARKLSEFINGSGEISRRRANGSELAIDSEYVAPFTVKWAQSADDGDGAWIIWLPSDEALLSVDGVAYDLTEDLDEVGGNYPEGWYILPDSVLDRTDGGSLYLNLIGAQTPASGGASEIGNTVQFDDEDIDEEEDIGLSIIICDASVDSTTRVRDVRQYVTSALIFAGDAFGNGSEANEHYYADEHSLSLVAHPSDDPSQMDQSGNHFHVKGFGKFSVRGIQGPVGTFTPATESVIEIGGDATTFAAVCRDGNTNEVDSNEVSYHKLKIRRPGSAPFEYEKSETADPATGTTVTTHKLVHCHFYWEGEYKQLNDFDVSGIMNAGTVYLSGKQAAPSAATPNPVWQWELSTALQTAPQGGKVLNFKLYDFSSGKIQIDYRSTFLSLEDTTRKAQIVVSKPTGSVAVTIDATGSAPKFIMTDGSHTVSIDMTNLPNNCQGNFSIHSLSYVDSNGDTQTYHGLFCDDIDLSSIKAAGGGGGGEGDEGGSGGGDCKCAGRVAWYFDPQQGWLNPYVQVGNRIETASGAASVADGVYYVSVNLTTGLATCTTSPPTASKTIVNLWVGTVASGKQVSGIYSTPVVFCYI